jgi:hypothetical protein
LRRQVRFEQPQRKPAGRTRRVRRDLPAQRDDLLQRHRPSAPWSAPAAHLRPGAG